ncbi:MAG: UDP-3-O-acyl-N-acetylglucosamine deacetylase [Planctomycetaceae bacterium]
MSVRLGEAGMAAAERSKPEQTTLCGPAMIRGAGLFHGRVARVRLLPAEAGTGIVFRRVDLAGSPEIPARVEYVQPGARRTILTSGDARVETTEHLLAALSGLRVDNCIVELDGAEVPAMDGSAMPFCEVILGAGICGQGVLRRAGRIAELQRISEPASGQWIECIPGGSDDLVIDYRLDYGAESPLPSQSWAVEVTPELFLREIAAARTFVMAAEVEALQAAGYGRHLTRRELVVFEADGSVQENQLRWDNEPVRHKVLDCIGDLALSGLSCSGRIVACRSGHKLNHVMARVLSTIVNMEAGNTVRLAGRAA